MTRDHSVPKLKLDLMEATLLRSILNEYTSRTDIPEERKDIAYSLLIKLGVLIMKKQDT